MRKHKKLQAIEAQVERYLLVNLREKIRAFSGLRGEKWGRVG